ncbi:MAG: cytochrome c1 [Henriciella sp.]|uniref:cytochrome c1 n=1 Tax=Henriciella sp. TaxID=1968823 RepID=UPI003C74CFF0
MNFLRFISAGLGAAALVASAHAAGGALHPHEPEGGWAFEGPLGELDMESVQRGYQVYREVCSSCHSMRLMSYRNLGEPGGPFYDPEYPNANDNPLVKSFAAMDTVTDPIPDEFGDPVTRPARPSDPFRSPFKNEQQARAANGGAYPPDLSVITKARHGGASYVYSLISGYPSRDATEVRVDGTNVETIIDVSQVESLAHGDDHYEGELIQPTGQYYNPYMAGDTTPQWRGDPRHAPPGGFLAMAPQLMDGRVTYLDGTEATVEQMSIDIANFLQWAGEPKQSQRKSLGLAAMIYLFILAILLWFSFHRIWRNVDH